MSAHRRQRSPAELSAFIDGELGPWRRWRVRAHLRKCGPCRAFVAQISQARGLMRTAQREPVSDELRASLLSSYARWAGSSDSR